MSLNYIDASMVQKAFLSSAAALDSKKEWINELNVFPVPDGDTGTNMTLTIMTAANEAAGLVNPDMETVCKVISSGTLRGARGNSGVITSQLLRGFTKVIRDEEKLDTRILGLAFSKAVETAYKAVMKPKEGTILTVARAMGEKAAEMAKETDDIVLMLDSILAAGNDMLAKTPDMLPVLKQAGVVDSGAQGLMVISEAAVASIKGDSLEFKGITNDKPSAISISVDQLETSDIRFGYCTEFIIYSSLTDSQEKEFKDFLESIGDSIVCVSDDEIFKVHVHTDDPGKAISKALTYGELSRLKIDNLREENRELANKNISADQGTSKREEYALIAVSAGKGLSDIFRGLGVNHIIEGGQTMNPSTDDIVTAIEKANADVVYVLPNNKNIILAARQAADIVEGSKVVVVSSRTVPHGIIAMMNFSPEATPEENVKLMTEAIACSKYCEITYAIRDTVMDGFEIHNGDYMAIGDKGMITVNKSKDDAMIDAIDKMLDDDSEIVTIYYGEDVGSTEAESIVDKLTEMHPEIDFDLEKGDQPVYSYFISVE